MKEKRQPKRGSLWKKALQLEDDNPMLAGPPLCLLPRPPDPLKEKAAALVMPLLRPKKITYQHLWTMLDGLWKLRSELHPRSKREYADSGPGLVDYLRSIPKGPDVFQRIRELRARLKTLPKGETAAKLIRAGRSRRKRVLSPEFKKLMAKKTVGSTREDLDAVRGDR